MPPRANTLELKIASDPANLAAARKSVEQLCRTVGFDETAIGEIGLCVNEALANVIRHAYNNAVNKPIEICAYYDGRQIVIAIRDWGNGIDPRQLPKKPHDPLTPGGIGLICMEKMLDEARFEPQRDGMLLTMKRAKTRAA
jgi:serine/threonine-protein kinase RsbW